jgi:hypothetical protein
VRPDCSKLSQDRGRVAGPGAELKHLLRDRHEHHDGAGERPPPGRQASLVAVAVSGVRSVRPGIVGRSRPTAISGTPAADQPPNRLQAPPTHLPPTRCHQPLTRGRNRLGNTRRHTPTSPAAHHSRATERKAIAPPGLKRWRRRSPATHAAQHRLQPSGCRSTTEPAARAKRTPRRLRPACAWTEPPGILPYAAQLL